jgi:hypothetical protein
MRLKLTRLLAAVVCAAFLTPLAASPAQADESAGPGSRPGCIGDSIKVTLESTKAICSGNYLVRMQPNGDLVLREISSGRACWASRTRAPGDASATLHDGGIAVYLTIDSHTQGDLATFYGEKPATDPEGGYNASVNGKGEFWVGFSRIASC